MTVVILRIGVAAAMAGKVDVRGEAVKRPRRGVGCGAAAGVRGEGIRE